MRTRARGVVWLQSWASPLVHAWRCLDTVASGQVLAKTARSKTQQLLVCALRCGGCSATTTDRRARCAPTRSFQMQLAAQHRSSHRCTCAVCHGHYAFLVQTQ